MDFRGGDWPTYRPRHVVVAMRLTEPAVINGRFFRDGYLVRTDGRLSVMSVADFEAIYERDGTPA